MLIKVVISCGAWTTTVSVGGLDSSETVADLRRKLRIACLAEGDASPNGARAAEFAQLRFQNQFVQDVLPLEMVGIKEGSVLELEVKDPIDVRPLESRGR